MCASLWCSSFRCKESCFARRVSHRIVSHIWTFLPEYSLFRVPSLTSCAFFFCQSAALSISFNFCTGEKWKRELFKPLPCAIPIILLLLIVTPLISFSHRRYEKVWYIAGPIVPQWDIGSACCVVSKQRPLNVHRLPYVGTFKTAPYLFHVCCCRTKDERVSTCRHVLFCF